MRSWLFFLGQRMWSWLNLHVRTRRKKKYCMCEKNAPRVSIERYNTNWHYDLFAMHLRHGCIGSVTHFKIRLQRTLQRRRLECNKKELQFLRENGIRHDMTLIRRSSFCYWLIKQQYQNHCINKVDSLKFHDLICIFCKSIYKSIIYKGFIW